jgi:hypothetical protein
VRGVTRAGSAGPAFRVEVTDPAAASNDDRPTGVRRVDSRLIIGTDELYTRSPSIVAMRFPRVSGSKLDGSHVTLPDWFDGDPTLVVVSFQWQQRSLVDPWCSVAERLAARYDDFEYYELLVVDWRSRMLIGRTRRADLLTGDQHERMVVVRVNKRQFRQSLGLLGEDTVYALLLDESHVVRQAAGFPDSSTVDGLRSLLAEWEAARPPVEADGGERSNSAG